MTSAIAPGSLAIIDRFPRLTTLTAIRKIDRRPFETGTGSDDVSIGAGAGDAKTFTSQDPTLLTHRASATEFPP